MINWLAIGSVSLYHVMVAETRHLFALASSLLCFLSVFIVLFFFFCVCMISFPTAHSDSMVSMGLAHLFLHLFLSVLYELTFHSLAVRFILKREILLLREFTTGLCFSMKLILNGC